MPSAKNPTNLSTGSGLAAQESVEAVSFVSPTTVGGLEGLEAHIDDPSRAHMALAIGIVDAADYFAADEVENALQEIGATFATGSQNGVVSGGTFTSVGLTVTLDPTIVRIGTNHDLSGEAELLTDGATNWLYVDPTGTLVHSVGAGGPSPFSPENVLLWRIVTAAGVVTSSTDARFFVLNLDRKLPYTVRSEGTALNQSSEACFVSLDAAMLWLGQFGSTAKKTKLVIRGSNTILSTVSLPVDNICIEGEDGAEFVTGAVLAPMFELATRSRVTFQNILFTAAHLTSTAIQESVGGASDLTIRHCQFSTGAQAWEKAVKLTGTNSGTLIEHCSITASDYGIHVTKPANALVQHCRVTSSALTAGTAAVSLGDGAVALPYTGNSSVRDCNLLGFGTSLILRGPNMVADSVTCTNSIIGIRILTGSEAVSVAKCSISLDSLLGTTGISAVAASMVSISDTKITSCVSGIVSTSTQVAITGTQILPSTTLGLLGISATGVGTEVTGCLVKMDRGPGTYGALENPQGIILTGSQSSVTGSTIQGVLNTVGSLGDAVTVGSGSQFSLTGNSLETVWNGYVVSASTVQVSGGSVSGCATGVAVGTGTRNVSVSGLMITAPTVVGVSVTGNSQHITITGCSIDGWLSGAPLLSTAEGISITNAAGNLPVAVTVTGCTIWRCKNGVVSRGTLANRPSKIHVTGNTIHHCGFAQDITVPVDGFETYPMGIGFNHSDDCVATSNLIYKIGSVINNVSVEAFWTAGAPTDDNNSTGINAWNCSRLCIQDNKITDTMSNGTGKNYGIYVQQKSAGSVATPFNTENIVITGNTLTWAGALLGNGTAYKGVVFDMLLGTDVNPTTYSCTNLSVSDNTVRRTRNNGIEVLSGAVSTLINASVDRNTVAITCTGGSAQTGGLSVGLFGGNAPDSGTVKHVSVSGNTIGASLVHGIYLAALHSGEYSDVRVDSNTVADSALSAIYLEATTASPSVVTLKQWSVSHNNLIEFASGAGLHHGIHVEDTSGACLVLAKFAINQNRLESSVAAGATMGAGIRVEGKDSSLWEFEVSGNQIQNPSSTDAATHFGGTGIFITTVPIVSVVGTSVFGLTVSNNGVWTESDAAFRLAVRGIATAVHITGNTFGTDTGYGARIALDSDAVFVADVVNGPFFVDSNQCFGGNGSVFQITNSTKLSDAKITNNLFSNSSDGLVFKIQDTFTGGDAAIKGLQFTGNTFRSITNTGLQLSLGVGGAGASAAMHNVSVCKNSFWECGTAGGGDSSLAVQANAAVQNLQVSGNEFQNCGGTTDDADKAVCHLQFGSVGGTAAIGVAVNQNVFSDSGGCAIRIADRVVGATTWTVRGLTVSGNQIRSQTNDAIKLDLANFTTVSQVNVTDNVVDGVSGAASDMGIVFVGPTLNNVTNIVVSRNNIASVGNSAAALSVNIPKSVTNMQIDQNTVSGGTVSVADISATVGLLWRNGSVSGNTVLDSNAHGIKVNIAGTAAGTSGMYGVQVSDNQIDTAGTDAVYVTSDGSGASVPVLRGCQVSGNTIRNAGANGVRVELLMNVGLFGLGISNNNISGAPGTGVYFYFSGTTDLQNIDITGNTVYNAGTGISVSSAGSASTVSALNVCSNSVSVTDGHGIYVGNGSASRNFHSLSVSGNTVKGWSANAGATDFGGVAIEADDLKIATVANNTCFTGETHAIAYWFVVEGATHGFSITGNSCDLNGAGNTESLRYEDAGTGTQTGLAITGNSFRGAVTGVNYTGTFAPSYSTVGYNNERTNGGAGTWAGFIVPFTFSVTLTVAVGNPVNQD